MLDRSLYYSGGMTGKNALISSFYTNVKTATRNLKILKPLVSRPGMYKIIKCSVQKQNTPTSNSKNLEVYQSHHEQTTRMEKEAIVNHITIENVLYCNLKRFYKMTSLQSIKRRISLGSTQETSSSEFKGLRAINCSVD